MKKYLLSLVVLITSLSSIQGQSIDQNYVKTTVYKKGFQEEVVNMAENDEKIETVQYFDGLGRPSQSVAVRQGGNKLENNIIDWKNNWILGSGSAPFFVQNGATTENQRINGMNPYEKESTLWQCTNDAVSGPDGGWNTDYFEIDNTVGYRYTVWVKRTGSQNGTTYHGTRNVNNLSGSTNTDPYFWSGDTPNLDQWYLMVGIIHPHTYTGSSTGVSGVYDMNGTRVKSGTEFKWASTTVTSSFRSYLDYSTDVNVKQYFYDPIVQRLDGNEATIDEILQGNVGKDIITHIEYDTLGRQAKNYLPYASTTNNGLYRNDALSATNNFYDTQKYENTLNPYSEQFFDETPLNLIVETAAPGNAWKEGIQEEHTVKNEYKLIENSDEVHNFHVNYDTNDIPQLMDNGLFTIGEAFQGDGYRAPTLYKFIIKNENWVSLDGNDNTTQTFKDYRGRTLLNRTFESGEAHDTYYVYDNYGNLCFVIPPKVTVVNGIDNTELNELCYQYIYDDKNRLIEKKIPGKGWEYIVYNKLDQPILTQDEIQRNKPTKEWLFVKYDAFGRVIYTGLKKTNNSRDYYQTTVDSSSALQYDTKRTTSQYLAGTLIYYNSNAIPTSFDEIYTINYYDDYNFDKDGITVPTSTNYVNVITSSTKGLATGTKIRILATDDWITTITAYDEHNRAVWIASKNQYLNTTDIIESKLEEDSDDIRGLVHETTTTHQKSGINIITVDEFTYDHTGRLLSQKQKINSQAEEKIVQNNYDELGQLLGKDVGGKTTKTALQNIDYKYNIRGWLKQINDVTNIGNDLFSFKLNYNDVTNGTDLYNGNISQTQWKTANTDNTLKTYTYTYDALNRITSGLITNSNSSENNKHNLKLVEYDKNGNITKLRRNGYRTDGVFDEYLDHLTYNYDLGNKLVDILEEGHHYEGFSDGSNTQMGDYSYDVNGNLTSDVNKGITSITYNYLNLPETLTINNNSNIGIISYIYDATGVKLQKTVNNTGESSVTTTDYAGIYVYVDSVLKQFSHPEGYVELNGSTFNYVYQYKDHLGSIRLTYKDIDGNGSVNSSEIIEENNYYPFGLKHKGYNVSILSESLYKYNGKELNQELDLNWYDYGARNYDAVLGRFMNIDPLADAKTQFDKSPFAYTWNNPINLTDPDGMHPDWNEEELYSSLTVYGLKGGSITFGSSGSSGPSDLIEIPDSKTSINDDDYDLITDGEEDPDPEKRKNGKKYQRYFRSQSVELKQEVANRNFSDYIKSSGIVATASSYFVSNGSYTQTNGKTGNFLDRPFNKLSDNAKSNFKFSKSLRFIGNLMTGLTLGYSAYQTFTGKATMGSFVYDASMVAVANKIPYVGIPLSIGGTIYKKEIMNWWVNQPRQNPIEWALKYGERE